MSVENAVAVPHGESDGVGSRHPVGFGLHDFVQTSTTRDGLQVCLRKQPLSGIMGVDQPIPILFQAVVLSSILIQHNTEWGMREPEKRILVNFRGRMNWHQMGLLHGEGALEGTVGPVQGLNGNPYSLSSCSRLDNHSFSVATRKTLRKKQVVQSTQGVADETVSFQRSLLEEQAYCNYLHHFNTPEQKSRQRVQLKRSGSPVPSCVSMMSDESMEPPIRFGDGTLDTDPRVKLDRPGSPVPSCVSKMSGKSMEPPMQFRGGALDTNPRVKLDRPGSPVPSCVSMMSGKSMDTPMQFRGGALDTNPRVKLDRPGSPVPSCVSMKSGGSMDPQMQFRGGALDTNPRSSRQQDVSCDFCTDKKMRAVKYCHVCPASYCETHVRQHYTVPALQKHRLVDISGAQEPRLCQQHHRALEVFCKTDQTLICSLCSVQEHMGHDTIFKSEERQTQDVGRAVSDLTDDLENFHTGGFQETDQTG
ncbi:uncharacterized protein [Lepisosteus oculatus]|uniref:uncharacterized protein n=1 Tax=Lepisosteus oculatus TaxID=7918 RepID=UPI0035F50CDC